MKLRLYIMPPETISAANALNPSLSKGPNRQGLSLSLSISLSSYVKTETYIFSETMYFIVQGEGGFPSAQRYYPRFLLFI
jgi:hypothetical protein